MLTVVAAAAIAEAVRLAIKQTSRVVVVGEYSIIELCICMAITIYLEKWSGLLKTPATLPAFSIRWYVAENWEVNFQNCLCHQLASCFICSHLRHRGLGSWTFGAEILLHGWVRKKGSCYGFGLLTNKVNLIVPNATIWRGHRWHNIKLKIPSYVLQSLVTPTYMWLASE